jgi:hypothetical protein
MMIEIAKNLYSGADPKTELVADFIVSLHADWSARKEENTYD